MPDTFDYVQYLRSNPLLKEAETVTYLDSSRDPLLRFFKSSKFTEIYEDTPIINRSLHRGELKKCLTTYYRMFFKPEKYDITFPQFLEIFFDKLVGTLIYMQNNYHWPETDEEEEEYWETFSGELEIELGDFLENYRILNEVETIIDPNAGHDPHRQLDWFIKSKEFQQLARSYTFEGDSNPLNLPHIDTWHDGQYKAQDGKTEEAIKLMTKAADEAEKYAKENQDGGVAGEAGYYRGTIAWLKKDYTTVEKYINDKFVKFTGNDEVLKRLLKNKGKSYKEAYNLKEASEANGINETFEADLTREYENDPYDGLDRDSIHNAFYETFQLLGPSDLDDEDSEDLLNEVETIPDPGSLRPTRLDRFLSSKQFEEMERAFEYTHIYELQDLLLYFFEVYEGSTKAVERLPSGTKLVEYLQRTYGWPHVMSALIRNFEEAVEEWGIEDLEAVEDWDYDEALANGINDTFEELVPEPITEAEIVPDSGHDLEARLRKSLSKLPEHKAAVRTTEEFSDNHLMDTILRYYHEYSPAMSLPAFVKYYLTTSESIFKYLDRIPGARQDGQQYWEDYWEIFFLKLEALSRNSTR